jgi:hypothetical protein
MSRRARGVGGLALVVMLLAGCGGSPPDLGTVEPREPIPEAPDGVFKLLTVEGLTMAAGRFEPLAVEIASDGRSMTIFFQGGSPECEALAGVRVIRHDPKLPDVEVEYGLRLGVMGCNAALFNLATRVALDPPFDDG